jgi:hypothetical protein
LLRKPVVLGSLALAAAFVPAHAGTVYIPFAAQQSLGSVQYRTEVVVANVADVAKVGTADAAASRFTTSFIATGQDGVQKSRPAAPISVLPGSSFVLTNVAPAGRDGMLEVDGPSQLAVSARLLVLSPAGQLLGSTPLPAVGSADATPAQGIAQIQGVARSASAMTQHFGVINLGTAAATCTATAYRVSGAVIGGEVRFTAPARSQTAFTTPLAKGALFADVRVAASCDQPFYAFALQTGPEAGKVSFLAPSGRLELSQLVAASIVRDGDGNGGGEVGNGGTGSGGTDDGGSADDDGSGPDPGEGTGTLVTGQDSLSFPGVFLAPRQGNSTRAFALPLRPGVRYRRVTVDFDLYLNKWQTPLFHAVTSLRRNDRTLYYGLILRGDRAKTILDLGHEQMAKGEGPWKPRTQYHIRTETDAGTRTVTLKVFRGGNLVHTVSGRLVANDLSVPAGKKMSVDFGIGKVADGAYFPPYGWQYSNLTVRAEAF